MSEEAALHVSYLPSAYPEIVQLEDDDILISFQGVKINKRGYVDYVMPVERTYMAKQPREGITHAGMHVNKRSGAVTYSFGIVHQGFNPASPSSAHGYVKAGDYQKFLEDPESMFDHPFYFKNRTTRSTHVLTPLGIRY